MIQSDGRRPRCNRPPVSASVLSRGSPIQRLFNSPRTTLGRRTLGANGAEPAAARSVNGIPTGRDSESAGFCRFSSNVASIRDKGLMEATPFPAQMRRTSIYSIPSGIQRPGAISQGGTKSGIAHPEPAREGVSPCPSNLRSVR